MSAGCARRAGASVAREGTLLETTTYDGLDNVVLTTDAEGRQTRFEYDKANRLHRKTDGFGTSDASLTTYAYDANGNLTETLDARAADEGRPFSEKRHYDALDRVERVNDGAGGETEFEYDAEGNRIAMVEPEGQRTEYEHDELGTIGAEPGHRLGAVGRLLHRVPLEVQVAGDDLAHHGFVVHDEHTDRGGRGGSHGARVRPGLPAAQAAGESFVFVSRSVGDRLGATVRLRGNEGDRPPDPRRPPPEGAHRVPIAPAPGRGRPRRATSGRRSCS